MSFSTTSSSTMTLAGALRPVGGGTFGGLVSTAWIGAPCGGPKSPPMSADAALSTMRAAAPVSGDTTATTTIAAAAKTFRRPQVMDALLHERSDPGGPESPRHARQLRKDLRAAD